MSKIKFQADYFIGDEWFKKTVAGELYPKEIYGHKFVTHRDPKIKGFAPYGWNFSEVETGRAVVKHYETPEDATRAGLAKLKKHKKNGFYKALEKLKSHNLK